MKFIFGPFGPWEVTIQSPIYFLPEGETNQMAKKVEKVITHIKGAIIRHLTGV